jgi:sulfide:quinone oxidoreductase
MATMKIAQLTPFLSVSQQLTPQNLGVAAAQGFKSVINNRPDGEGEDQPSASALAAMAERLGLAYRHIPVVSGKIADADVEAFAKALNDLKGPVLAFCRTGTRSTTLWALTEAWHLDPEAILKTAASAGYNIDGLRPRLEVPVLLG